MSYTVRLLTILLGVLVTSTLTFASATTAAAENPFGDKDIAFMVQQQLAEGKIVKTGELGVSVAQGVVTLRGTVPHVWARDRAVKLAMEVAGVQAVDSELDIAFEESDKKLGENVAKEIRRYVFFTIYDDVNIGVGEGIVTLTGRVTWPFKATEIAERVSRVLGVQELRSEIQVLPVNTHDSRLRRVLAFRIYRDPLFVGLGNRVNPPIHIVVERGRVTLTGAVRSKVEKRKAEIIARSTFGVFSVENRLTVG